MDKWTAYQPDAQAVLDFLATRKPSNPVVLTGDIHIELGLRPARAPVGSVVADRGAASSSAPRSRRAATASRSRRANQAILPDNPHIKFHNGQRGYARCTIGRDRWTTDYRVVPFVSRPGASVETRASLVVENGRPGVHRA